MNPNELAAKMLLWAEKKNELDKIEAEIAGAVLAIGQSKTTGDVVASYSKGRAEYDYETPTKIFLAADPRHYDAIVEKFTKTEPVTDWRAIAKELSVEPIVLSRTGPSVTVKLKNGKDGSK